ncbi:ribosomal RNA-processing family protein [Babesia bovis T2Bo]|uniref:rRNA biogenesis protein RRP36 n=1 Tax=Babesia bovis TaxID=5865 RepID=A7APL8_BABBO|nr:ribosomal RNA-processing family protein [Babesia bovis T2Bo]EDO08502.1 ribosomal RNA-processing family protein [Babesia bovis T2Bo]|eukprot:XP_001612070.1 hypothetical protein [Babesia bovis T2Bo]
MDDLTLGELKALKESASATSEHRDDTNEDVNTERAPLIKSQKTSQTSAPVKKRSSKAPVTLSNDVAYNPYQKLKFDTKGGKNRMKARDPRFSDFSGTLNDDLFRKSYAFLGDMLQDEVKEIKSALRVSQRAGVNSIKTANALRNIAHMNISSLSDAKRALDRYTTQQKQLKSDQALRDLKKDLITEEKQKIATTSKTPFYYSTKKVKKMLRDKERDAIEAALQSSAINADGAGKIHKKVSKESRRKLTRQRRSGQLDALNKTRDS